MCQDFSCIVTQSYQVVWKRGVSSHDRLYSMFEKDFPELKDNRSVKIEITPDKGYLYPEKSWTFKVDENEIPSWFTDSHKKEALKAHEMWKKETYALINLKEARNPVNPLSRKRRPTAKDIQLLKDWDSVGASVGASVWYSVWDSVRASVRDSVGDSVRDSVWDSVRASVWDSVRDSVRDSVWVSVGDSVWDSVRASVWDSVRASVRAYIGYLFGIWDGQYKFQPAADLWKRGFVPSFDGKTWRLHSGKKAEVVYEWTP